MTTVLSEPVSGYAFPVRGGDCKPGLLRTLAYRLRNLFVHNRANFHTVVPRGLYRSGQMNPKCLAKCIEELGIRSIINMRGANQEHAWYRAERETAGRLGVEHHDFRLHSQTLPTRRELRWLVFLFDVCPRPVLIHCEAGAERSGLAAAIFLLLDPSGSLAKASGQLSLRYRVAPWHKAVRTGQRLFECYRGWLADRDCRHAPEHFRRWACKGYRTNGR